MNQKRILFCILNWGLGHATRSMPIIRALREKGHEVLLVSTGRSLALLRKEFPDCPWFDCPDYAVTYSRHPGLLILHLLAQMPRIFYRLYSEHAAVRRIVQTMDVDLIVSDNRYGCHVRGVPSYFMIHQLRFQLPRGLQWSAFISEWFNRIYFRHFRAVLVPDAAGGMNLSGALSHRGRIARHPKLNYIGLLSSLPDLDTIPQEDIDILFLISGPEPSRTVFEKAVLEQAEALAGRKSAVLGKPEDLDRPSDINAPALECHAHLNRSELTGMILRARMVICRSGYSTMMELAALGRQAILIPTPGQTEQEYLARHAMDTGLFYSVPQKNLDLPKAVQEANAFYTEKSIRFPVNQIRKIMHILE